MVGSLAVGIAANAAFGSVYWRSNGHNDQSVVRLDDTWRSHVFIEPSRGVPNGDISSQQQAAVWAYYGRFIPAPPEDIWERMPVPYSQEQDYEEIPANKESSRQLQSCQTQHCPGGLGVAFLQQEFIRGYTDAGGPPEYLQHFLYDVIPCESGWQPDPGNPDYVGLGQFVWSTWVSVRRAPDADWLDPYEQGWAVGYNAAHSDPYGQWPVCFLRGL